jgi:hypothetical protein
MSSMSKSRIHRPENVEEAGHPHCCVAGFVYLGYTAFDEVVGDEVERIEAIPCRRCTNE